MPIDGCGRMAAERFESQERESGPSRGKFRRAVTYMELETSHGCQGTKKGSGVYQYPGADVRQTIEARDLLHRGLSPITHTGDYSDVVVVDADGRRIPWPDMSRFDENEMRDLMREIVNKIYTFFGAL